jgi:hypothetical protein
MAPAHAMRQPPPEKRVITIKGERRRTHDKADHPNEVTPREITLDRVREERSGKCRTDSLGKNGRHLDNACTPQEMYVRQGREVP